MVAYQFTSANEDLTRFFSLIFYNKLMHRQRNPFN